MTTLLPHLDCQIDQGIALIRLDHPPMNAVSAPMTRSLYALLHDLAANDDVRAVVLTGAGDRAFCAGSDIRELTTMTTPGAVLEKKLIFQNKVFDMLRTLPKPTIAALNGTTFGGGLEIALCCDLVVAGQAVKLGLPEIKLGVFPSSGGTFRMARRIGESRAKAMIFLGEPIMADAALAYGLVHRVVPQPQVLDEAMQLARQLAAGPALALQQAKAVIQLAFDRSDAEALAASLQSSDRVFCSADAQEGIAAFLEKRQASFG